MYLALLTVGLCLSYVVFVYGLPWFFHERPPALRIESVWSVLAIASVAWASFFTSFALHDVQLANRVLHIFGGGFTASLAVILAARDSRLGLGRVRVLILTTVLVTSMGVVNELVEFALDSYTPLLFSSSRLDTWYDLASNLLGIAIALPLFALLIPPRRP